MKVFTLKTQLGTMPCSIDLKKSAEDIYLGVGSVTKAATANCCIFRHYTFCKAEWIAAVNTIEKFGRLGGMSAFLLFFKAQFFFVPPTLFFRCKRHSRSACFSQNPISERRTKQSLASDGTASPNRSS